MNGSPAILQLGAASWRVLASDRDRPAELPSGDTAAVAAAVGAGGVAWMALPARDCRVVTLASAERVDTRAGRRNLLFELEEHAPIVAEDTVADFIESDRGLLAVVAEAQPLSEAIAALRLADVDVGPIAPWALLVLEGLIRSSEIDDTDFVLIPEGGGWSVVRVHRNRPTAWHWVGPDPRDVEARIKLLGGDGEAEVVRTVVVDGDARFAEALATGGRLTVRECGATAETLARDAVDRLAAARERPMIDLRRDALATRSLESLRRPIVACAAAVVALMLAITASCLVLAARYDAAADAERVAQHAVYRALFPDGGGVPTDVAGRLASQRQLLASGAAGGAAVAESPAALDVLREVFTAIPSDAMPVLTRLSIDAGRIEIVGESATHGEAARLAEALGEGGRFTVDPPQTVALRDGGVGFTLRGSARASGGAR